MTEKENKWKDKYENLELRFNRLKEEYKELEQESKHRYSTIQGLKVELKRLIDMVY